MNEKSEQEQLFLLARDALQDTLRHQERRTALLWRLFLSDMRYYALFALISIPILILLSSASQSGMTFSGLPCLAYLACMRSIGRNISAWMS